LSTIPGATGRASYHGDAGFGLLVVFADTAGVMTRVYGLLNVNVSTRCIISATFHERLCALISKC